MGTTSYNKPPAGFANLHFMRRQQTNGQVGKDVGFERVRNVNGYIGLVSGFNTAKQAEERDRVKHEL